MGTALHGLPVGSTHTLFLPPHWLDGKNITDFQGLLALALTDVAEGMHFGSKKVFMRGRIYGAPLVVKKYLPLLYTAEKWNCFLTR